MTGRWAVLFMGLPCFAVLDSLVTLADERPRRGSAAGAMQCYTLNPADQDRVTLRQDLGLSPGHRPLWANFGDALPCGRSR